jgi:hypothetical protein
MKKLAAVLLIMLFVGNSSLWAVDSEWLGWGMSGMLLGGSFAALGLIPGLEDGQIFLFGIGGLTALFGLIGIIIGLSSDGGRYAQADDNNILEHVVFSTTGNQTYIGLRFSF